MKKERIALSFSGGKDSMMALYYLKQSPKFEVCCLVTAVSEVYQRVLMQGVRASLITQQAAALGLPLIKVMTSKPTKEAYERQLKKAYATLKEKGINRIAYGDVFLDDLKTYREQLHHDVGLEGLYPLWQKETQTLVQTFLNLGFKAIIAAADAAYFEEHHVGSSVTEALIASLPKQVDPAGERGEFHTFVYDGPLFRYPLAIKIGTKVNRMHATNAENKEKSKGFWYADILIRD
jgi:uncharacterized protein (TIGR00290 family)